MGHNGYVEKTQKNKPFHAVAMSELPLLMTSSSDGASKMCETEGLNAIHKALS